MFIITGKKITTLGNEVYEFMSGLYPNLTEVDECFYNIAKDCKDYMDFLFEMQSMIGSFATPDGADWGEANIEEMNELVKEISDCN